MPGGAAPRALLGLLALFMAVTVAVVPVVEARPKDRNRSRTTCDRDFPGVIRSERRGLRDAASAAEQPLTAGNGSGSSNEQTLLALDADGDYIPDALDNCPMCRIPIRPMQTVTATATPAPSTRTPTATLFPTNRTTARTLPLPTSPTGTATVSATPVTNLRTESSRNQNRCRCWTITATRENGAATAREWREPGRPEEREVDRGQRSVIAPSSPSRSSPPCGLGGRGDRRSADPDEPPAEEPVRDNPRRNEELIAEAAASGELDAPPEPPPAPQRAWDEEAVADSTEWDSIVKIDAGAAADAESTSAGLVDDEPNDAGSRTTSRLVAMEIRLTSQAVKYKTVTLPAVGSGPSCCYKKTCRKTNPRMTPKPATAKRRMFRRTMLELVTAPRRCQSRTVS